MKILSGIESRSLVQEKSDNNMGEEQNKGKSFRKL